MSGYNLTTLMKRLEAATSRLEDLVQLTEETGRKASVGSTPGGRQNSGAHSTTYQALGKADANADANAEVSPKSKATDVHVPVSDLEIPPALTEAPFGKLEHQTTIKDARTDVTKVTRDTGLPEAFDKLKPLMEELVALSSTLDETLSQQTALFAAAASAALDAVRISNKAKKPADLQGEVFAKLIEPVSAKVSEIITLRETNRASAMSNHFASLAEGAPVFGWFSSDSPADYIQNFKDSSQFYGNRVLKEFKSEPQHTQWVKALLSYFNALKLAVDSSFKKGLTWNENGEPLESVIAGNKLESDAVPVAKQEPTVSSTSTANPASIPPPPPPLDTAKLAELANASQQSTSAPPAGGLAAVFSDLSSSGASAASQLKHIDRKALSETNKKLPPRPPSKAQKPSKGSPQAVTGTKPAASKPARTVLEDNRWFVENYVEDSDVVVNVEMNQTVHIDNCFKSTIRVQGKATMVTINKSKKSGVLVESLVSGVEIIKSEDIGLQVTGFLPSLTIDQSHSVQAYLSKESLDLDIYTSQTTAININIPQGADGDYKEMHLPEQILHKLVGNGVESTAISASGK